MPPPETEKHVARKRAPRSQQRPGRLGLRTTVAQQHLLRRAAEATHKSLTDFVLDSACAAAEQALADQRYFLLNDAQWEKFEAALARPTQTKSTLVKLFASRAPWEEE